jgi:hypothetical protein
VLCCAVLRWFGLPSCGWVERGGAVRQSDEE